MDRAFKDPRYVDAHFMKAPIPVAWVGVDGKFIKVNRALCDLLGYSRQELEKLSWQNVTNSLDIGGDESEVEESLKTGEGYTLKKRYISKDGQQVWIQLYVIPIVSTSDSSPRSVDHFVSWIMPLRSPHQQVPYAVLKKDQDGKAVVVPENPVWAWVKLFAKENPKTFVACCLFFLLASGILSDNATDVLWKIVHLILRTEPGASEAPESGG